MISPDHSGLPLEVIPAGSSLLIDGNGLAFYLFKVAYARHLKTLFTTSQQTKRMTASFPAVKSLRSSDVVQAIPSMMPVNLVEDITHEFITHLRSCKFRIQVFWDGPQQRFKTVTVQKRRQQRQQEWSNLQQYCEHGSLPNEKSVFGFLKHFPLPGLFLHCVRQVLCQQDVEMMECPEEADVALAQTACGDARAFVLGQDSDFYFYKDIQYVPLDGIFIAAGDGTMHACVGRRRALARLLDIADEDMTELAILLGNDYLTSVKIPQKRARDPLELVEYLNAQEDGFRVQAKKLETELSFVRALYNLQDLDSFPLQEASEMATLEPEEDQEMTKHLKIKLPVNSLLDVVDDAILEGLDLMETIHQCLSLLCADQTNNEEVSLLEIVHLDAYDGLMSSLPNHTVYDMERPPLWADVRASCIIEKCISIVLKSPRASSITRLAQPSSLFNHLRYLCILASKQIPEDSTNDVLSKDNGLQEEEEAPPVFAERRELPIDSHEERIIANIANHRVTIIHGETGCGKSSRVPVMLLDAPSPEPSLPKVKFFISQPRR